MSAPDSSGADAANDRLIVSLYEAMNRGDGEAMAACYHPEARFSDPAFGELRGEEVKNMWRMLTERGDELEVELREHQATSDSGSAHWIARYPFGNAKRPVVNDIRARYRFRDGLIAEHDDTFDLRRWAAQAMGTPGKVLGFTPLLSPLVRRTARGQLAKFEG